MPVEQGHGEGDREPTTREYLLASACLFMTLATWESMGVLLHNLQVCLWLRTRYDENWRLGSGLARGEERR